jgi:hypothetical protein
MSQLAAIAALSRANVNHFCAFIAMAYLAEYAVGPEPRKVGERKSGRQLFATTTT